MGSDYSNRNSQGNSGRGTTPRDNAADSKAGKQTCKQAGRQNCGKAGKQICRQSGRKTCKQAGEQGDDGREAEGP